MRTRFLILLTGVLVGSVDSFGQQSESDRATVYSKIVIEMGDSLFVETDSLLVDTLVMKDYGSLNFLRKKNCLAVSHAFIGDHCRINAVGRKGQNASRLYSNVEHGTDGKDLTVSIRFEELGSLYVNTFGGNGGQGTNGERNPIGAGIEGGRGGSGGKGGNLNFFYLTPHFVVVFHEVGKHSVFLNSADGKGGVGGMGGEGGSFYAGRFPIAYITRGKKGFNGLDGSPGMLRFLRTESYDDK